MALLASKASRNCTKELRAALAAWCLAAFFVLRLVFGGEQKKDAGVKGNMVLGFLTASAVGGKIGQRRGSSQATKSRAARGSQFTMPKNVGS